MFLKGLFQQIIQVGIQFIYPPRCLGCDCLLDDHVCDPCCKPCLDELSFYEPNFIRDSDILFKEISKGVSVFCYEGLVKSILLHYKFGDRPDCYRGLAVYLSQKIDQVIKDMPFDLIVAVPLSRGGYGSRHYNQSELIAMALSKKYFKPNYSKFLKKVRETNPQSLSNRLERKRNLIRVFEISKKNIFNGKNILIVDDIITTGSTVEELAQTLKNDGALKVYVAVVASTVKTRYWRDKYVD